MDGFAAAFVHVLLFQCPACRSPLSAHRLSQQQNLEEADEALFKLGCDCGWSGAMVGLKARRHWVEPWERHRS
jgi:hypothetical protein